MNGDEDLGEDIIMKGEPYHYVQKSSKAKDEEAATQVVSDEAEKVSVLQTPIAHQRTTFTAQKEEVKK